MSNKIRTARAKLAAATRHHPEQNHDDLRRELRAARAEKHVKDAVESYPPLTADQLQSLSAALHPHSASLPSPSKFSERTSTDPAGGDAT